MKFTQEKKTEWINWLRDNPDLQGRGALRDKQGKYCCLGGYCLLNADEVNGLFKEGFDIYYFTFGSVQNESFLPPGMYINGLNSPEINFKSYIHTNNIDEDDDRTSWRYTFAELNNDGLTFSQIADLIEFFISPDL